MFLNWLQLILATTAVCVCVCVERTVSIMLQVTANQLLNSTGIQYTAH